jgi:Nif-specific regulatory protein
MRKATKKSFSEKERNLSIHSYEELATLHAIAKILAQPQDLRDQLALVLQEMSYRLGMKRGMISLLDREKKEAWLDIAHDVNIEGMDVTYKPGEGITGKVAETGRPMAIANLGQATHFLDRTGARRHLNRSELAFLCVPIIYDANVIGVLSADKVAIEVEDLDKELAMLSSVAELMAKAVHIRALEEENERLRKIVGSERAPSIDIIGHSKPMQEVFGLVAQVSDSNTTVLITGETGTGKELIARAIHMNSPRHKGPMVQVNCAAIPDTLIESELFGHERGAFTGALHQRRGRFEEANGGTIFLDEVGELSAAAQVKLLRVLQEKRFQPLGSSRIINVNVRIIAATNRDLEQDIVAGRFRADLFYRLNVFPIYLPSLKYSKEMGKNVKKISTAAIEVFLSHKWPGNVRELENCIERAVLLSNTDTIDSFHLPPSLHVRETKVEKKDHSKLTSVVEAQERSLIIDTLEVTGGNQTKAAKILGTTKRIIQYKISKLGINPKLFRKNNKNSDDTD